MRCCSFALVDHLFVFEGEGVITDFPGNYTIYRNKMLDDKEREKMLAQPKKKVLEQESTIDAAEPKKLKLSFNEKREYELLENEITKLENRKSELELLMNSGTLPHEELYEKSEEFNRTKKLLDEKELRWLELSELM